jgi:hypothetical protein
MLESMQHVCTTPLLNENDTNVDDDNDVVLVLMLPLNLVSPCDSDQ